jgi:pyruvate dehydrogenase E2 component (dihydrolipoamide acetyltransferase)
MAVSVTMPRLGESVSEGTVTRWLKKEGERVEADEPLLEVSTDKVDTEIPSPAAGVLKSIKVGEDETVEVGSELAVIEDGAAGGEPAPAAEQPEQPEQPEQTEEQQPEQPQEAEHPSPEQPEPEAETDGAAGGGEGGRPQEQQQPERTPESDSGDSGESAASTQEREAVAADAEPAGQPEQPEQPEQRQQPEQKQAAQQPPERAQPEPAAEDDEESGRGPSYVTPLVRRLAAEHGVDLAKVSGTGVGGRIRKQDVIDAARSGGAGDGEKPAAPAARSSAQAAGPAAQRQPATAPAAAGDDAPQRGTTEKLSRLRRVIAERMVESLQVSAQLTTVVEADLTRIARLRDRAKAEFEQREGVKLSYLPFFALAVCEALREHPQVNSSIDVEGGTVTYHDAVHLGIAVDTPRGLLVPVVKDASDLNLAGLARKIADIAERTRGNHITPDELGGGTFTLTNTGSRGALFDTPIINQPQVGILGTGGVVKRAVVVDDPDVGEVIAVRQMVYLALTYDHRMVDGADAARFLTTVKSRLEEGEFDSELGL